LQFRRFGWWSYKLSLLLCHPIIIMVLPEHVLRCTLWDSVDCVLTNDWTTQFLNWDLNVFCVFLSWLFILRVERVNWFWPNLVVTSYSIPYMKSSSLCSNWIVVFVYWFYPKIAIKNSCIVLCRIHFISE